MEKLIETVLTLGADKAAIVDADKIELSETFLSLCEQNSCGVYGRCYMCPPDVGNIKELMASLSQYRHALVFQIIGALEDSYDIEGMHDARVRHKALCQAIKKELGDEYFYLGSGGCGVCKVCAKVTKEPCRAPHLAMSSLEAYGINVSTLAKLAGMNYINGKNTVTYFGAVFIK